MGAEEQHANDASEKNVERTLKDEATFWTMMKKGTDQKSAQLWHMTDLVLCDLSSANQWW